jgi:hypothetical protein
MIASNVATKRRVGRPSVSIKPEQVDELKRQDVSWRQIGKMLGIGTATAMRLFRSIESARPNIQDAPPKTPKRIEQRGLARPDSVENSRSCGLSVPPSPIL